MTDLIAFLNARLDEDEKAARDAQAYDIEAEAEDFGPTTYQVASWAKAEPPVQAFVNRMTPARVLREVEAKRGIIERAEFVTGHGPAVDHVRAMDMTVGASSALQDVLRMLAAAYSDHADYREEWRP